MTKRKSKPAAGPAGKDNLAAIEFQLRFEQTVAGISNLFINTPSAEIDRAIMTALRLSGEFFQAERSYLFQFSEDGSRQSNTHEWCAEGIEPQREEMQNLKTEEFSWHLDRLRREEHLSIPDVAELPPEAEKEKQFFIDAGIQSLILIGMFIEGEMKGFFGFDLPAGRQGWVDQQIPLLKVITGIIAGSVAKAYAEKELHKSEEMFRSISDNAFDLIALLDLDGNYIYCNDSYLKVLGYSSEDLVNSSAFDLIHPAEKSKITQLLKEGILNRQHDAVLLIRLLSMGGSIKWLEHRVKMLFNEEEEPDKILINARDFTESKINRDLLIVQRNLGLKLAGTSDITEALRCCLDAAISVSGMDSGGVYLVNQATGALDLVCHKGLSPDFYIAASYYDPDTFEATLVREGLPAYITGSDERLQKTLVTREGIRAYAVIPITSGQKTVACLNIASHTTSEIPRAVRGALETVVSKISSAIDRIRAENALQESVEKYRTLVANVPGIIFSCAWDPHWTMSYISDSVEALTGFKASDFIGNRVRSFASIIHPEDRAKVFREIRGYNNAEEIPYHRRYRVITSDGAVRWVRESGRVIYNQDGLVDHIDGVIIDITDLVSYEEQLKYLSLHDQLTGLYNRVYFEAELARFEISRDYPISIISSDLDGLKLINDAMGHDAGDRLLKKCANLLQLSFRASDILARIGGDEFSAILPETDNETGEKIARRIRRKIAKYNHENPDLPLSLSMGVATTSDNSVSLKDLFKEADDYMYRDKLHSNVSSRNRVVNCLLTALAERDFITEGHAVRLEDLCLAMGEKKNLTSRQLRDLALLAQVHDLGKVGIPDRILFKPGSLDKKEWEVMKQHAEKGYRIALASPDLAGVADYILKHHEHWDGSGYPLGLKKDEIPIECRILAIVDAFDAMTNDRPYSRAISIEDAISELQRCSGAQFDPDLVETFFLLVKPSGESGVSE
jgi:diguanylate cyclase (GGDEF)-like protein/PAS domain S-box-containing protein